VQRVKIQRFDGTKRLVANQGQVQRIPYIRRLLDMIVLATTSLYSTRVSEPAFDRDLRFMTRMDHWTSSTGAAGGYVGVYPLSGSDGVYGFGLSHWLRVCMGSNHLYPTL
jgi:hypothetical protein